MGAITQKHEIQEYIDAITESAVSFNTSAASSRLVNHEREV